jgi:hypothetical protein
MYVPGTDDADGAGDAIDLAAALAIDISGADADAVPEADTPLTPEDMLQTARELRDAGQFDEAYAMLVEWFSLYDGSGGSDLAHFLMGMLLVESQGHRDVRGGMSHLAVVRSEYPRSPVFHEADAEYRRLQRHFVHVR